jgi:pimeloyl-ACP methyl ester carboxylesterase
MEGLPQIERSLADLAAADQEILSIDEEATLEVIDLPTVVIVGTEDRMTPVARSRRMAELNPKLDLVELEGYGHLAQMTAAGVVNDAISRLAGVEEG